MLKNKVLWLFCLSILSATVFNQFNLTELRKSNPDLQTVTTADDASYLNPAINFWEKGEWKTDDPGLQSYFLRTPGYGIFYLSCYALAGSNALVLVKILQLILFALSVVFIYQSLLLLKTNEKVAFFSCFLYGTLPFASNFVFYTLTEGITPFLVSWYLLLLIQFDIQKRTKYLMLASLVFGYMILVRPMLAPLVAGLVAPIFQDYNFSLRTRIIVLLLTLGPLGIWQVRNTILSGNYVQLHPIYMADNKNMFRLPHQALGELFKCWGSKPEDFHAITTYLWEHTQHPINEEDIKILLMHIPKHVQQFPIDSAFVHLQQLYGQFKQLNAKEPIPEALMTYEKKVTYEINYITTQYKSQNRIRSYLISPIQSFFRLTFHSNLSLYMFQHTWRGNFAMEILRWICLLLHAGIILIPILLLFKWRWKYYLLFILAPFSYIFYLSFFQVMNEERYLQPLLPLLLVGSVAVAQYYWKKVQSLKSKVY